MSPSIDNKKNQAPAEGYAFLSPNRLDKRDKREWVIDSSDRDSVSSARDNDATELSSLSRRTSPSLAGSCDQDTSFDLDPGIIPQVRFHPTPDHCSLFEASGSDCESSNPPVPIDASNRAAMRGQGMLLLDPSFGPKLRKEPSEVSDLGNREYINRKHDDGLADSSDDGGSDDDPLAEEPLENKLLADQHQHRDGRKGFIPRGHITRTISEQGVAQHLYERLPHLSAEERRETVPRYVKQIFQQGPDQKSYVQIFAILVLTGKSECIGDFLEEEIDDGALPFQRCVHDTKGHSQRVTFRPRRGGKRIKAFDNWNKPRKQEFHEWQWAVNAPFFHRGKDGEAKIFSLQDSATLPFIRFNPRSGNQEIEEYRGGFGKVTKRFIHADHHSLREHEKPNSAFAIKKLNSKSYKEFKAEFDMLAKLGETKHQHLVSLLGAYCHLNNNYLIFDWADSDLSKFWQNHPMPDFNSDTVLWVAEQCAGLASGLQQIHRYGSIEQQRRSTDPTQPKLYGRHGDIKPENILWFSGSGSSGDGGTLRICDFGVSEFHTVRSRSNRANKHVALSPYYRPPECQLKDGTISRSYDIWTIGCLYLEFLAWLLGGWSLVRAMVIARSSGPPSSNYGPSLDFDYPYFDINDRRTRATIKPAVIEFFESAHANPKCSDFVHEFLDIIQKSLLVVETNDSSSYKRMACGQLHTLLDKMARKCRNKPEYAMKGKPRAMRR
ncbi:hypothetical protein ACHAPJ_008747 [Fusarium lateritium]